MARQSEVSSPLRCAAAVCAMLLGLGATSHADAALVGYDWVGTGGTGSMIFDLGSATDGADFSIPKAALVGFDFTFGNGDQIMLSGLNAISVTGNLWSAAGGFLTTVAQLSETALPLPNYTFQIVPYLVASPDPTGSTAVDQGSTGTQQNFGYWKLSSALPLPPSPVPAAVWMMGTGLIGLLCAKRRKRGLI